MEVFSDNYQNHYELTELYLYIEKELKRESEENNKKNFSLQYIIITSILVALIIIGTTGNLINILIFNKKNMK